MTGITLEVEIDDAEARAGLDRLARAGEDLSPAMDEIGAMLVAATQRRFERGIDPEGRPWLPSKRALKTGGKTLIERGLLMASITHRFDSSSVEVGSNLVYAAIHQLGGKIQQKARSQTLAFGTRGGRFASRASTRRRRSGSVRVAFASIGARVIEIPARPYLGVGADDAREIVNIVTDHLAGALGSSPRAGGAA